MKRQWRNLEERLFIWLMRLSLAIVLGCLAAILLTMLIKGLPSLSLAMITQTPTGGYYLGKGGGILNAIVGSLLLASGATIVAFILSLGAALYLNMYLATHSKTAAICRFAADALGSVPSIVYGAFGFTLMLLLGLRMSLLAGIITVALFITPLMIRAMDEVLRLIPHELADASFTLGATRFETATKVIVRQALPGITTAVLISFGRAIGDAAAVMLTTGFTDNIPTSVMQPAATLPLAIFFQLSSPIPAVQNRAYAAALILTLLIVLISFVTRIIARRMSRHSIH